MKQAIRIYHGGRIQFHPSEAIEVSGITEDGREVSIYLPEVETKRMIKEMARIFKYTDHLGHAFWHYKNPDAKIGKRCDMCRKAG